jgi:uncharacterized protein (UPF0332 family)/predicted nucleotidyltransferase
MSITIGPMKDIPILEKKHQAIEDFTRRLLTSEVGDSIAKIVLFGSVLGGEASEESDIDLLIIALDALDRVKEVASEASFDTILELGEGVEPIVHCIDHWRFPPSYLVYKVKREGKEIYGMDEQEIRRRESRVYSQLAEEYLEGAQRNLEARDYRIAIDAGYNAAELCAKALLLLRLTELPRTHRGIVNKFSEFYVKGGPLSKELGRRFNAGLDLRNQARYEPHARLGEDEAKEIIEVIQELHRALSSQLELGEEE